MRQNYISEFGNIAEWQKSCCVTGSVSFIFREHKTDFGKQRVTHCDDSDKKFKMNINSEYLSLIEK